MAGKGEGTDWVTVKTIKCKTLVCFSHIKNRWKNITDVESTGEQLPLKYKIMMMMSDDDGVLVRRMWRLLPWGT